MTTSAIDISVSTTAMPHSQHLHVMRRVVALICVQTLWMFLAVALFTPLYTSLLGGDVGHFFTMAEQTLAGKTPYVDFVFEYPPGALGPILAPKIISSMQSKVGVYLWLFVAQNALFSAGITVLLARWSGLRSAVIFNALLAIGAAFVPLRFDLLPALLTLTAVYWAEDRPCRAGMALALGTCVKLYPAVLLPVLLLVHLSRHRWKNTALLAGAFFGVVLVIVLPFWIFTDGHMLDFLSFHRQRGLQIESLGSGLVLLVSKATHTVVSTDNTFNSLNINTPWTKIIADALQWVMLGSLALHFALRWRRWRDRCPSRGELVQAAITTLWIFIAANKVFSPQYVIWVLPLAALAGNQRLLSAILWLVTSILFPFLYHSLQAMNWLPVIILNVRNALVVGLIVEYGRGKAKIEGEKRNITAGAAVALPG